MKQKSCEPEENETQAIDTNQTDSRRLFLELVEACKRKDLNTIHRIANERPNLLFCHDKYHRNVLHYAAILINEHSQSLTGVSTKRPSPAPSSSLDSENAANTREQASRCLECFRFLLDKCGQDSERLAKLWTQVDLDGLTILHLAVISCNSLLVREILFSSNKGRLKSLVGALDKEHHSPLHWAVITNDLTCVQLLINSDTIQLAHQADLNGATPIHYATQTSDYPKYRQQLRQMLKNATTFHKDPLSRADGKTSDWKVSSKEAVKRQRSLTRGSSVPNQTGDPLRATDEPEVVQHYCTNNAPPSSDNNLDVLVYLVHLPGIELECQDRDARTPLLWAASSGNRQAIAILLSAGANPLCKDANQLGALHCAASHGFIDCLECLLGSSSHAKQMSAQINQPDKLNCTPLFYAVLSGNIDCVELLLERGAQHDWQDVKGRTAAHFAALKGQLNTLKLLEARQADLWLANKQGDLPLHYAIKSGRQQVVAWLLERSPYEHAVNAINNIGRAPIHLAIFKNSPPMVDFLIRRGANLNQLVKVRDISNKLGAALKRSQSIEVNTLVNRGPSHATKGGGSYHYETAIDIARRLQRTRCLELLEGAAALSASEVLVNRQTSGARSVFDLQIAEVASPIGFETSASSTEPQSERTPTTPLVESELTRKAPGSRSMTQAPPAREFTVPQSDSTGSSALSQSSITSVRGLPSEPKRSPVRPTGVVQDSATPAPHPFKGGIKYQNEHMNASIKCKLYKIQTADKHRHKQAYGIPSQAQADDKQHRLRSTTNSMSCGGGGGQEIVTNVNVFTSPVNQCDSCARTLKSCNKGERYDSTTTTESDEANSDTTSTTAYDEESDLRDDEQVIAQQQQNQVRYVPPSQAYTQHLPAILSAEEERSTSGDTVGDHEAVRSATKQVETKQIKSRLIKHDEQDSEQGQAIIRCSPLARQYHDSIKSPVANYIRGQQRPVSLSRAPEVRSSYQAYSRADYSQVRAKVDSHRYDSGLSSQHFADEHEGNISSASRRSKSWSTLSSSGGLIQPHSSPTNRGHLRSPFEPHDESPRSYSRQTITKSVDSVELASSVEKSIRKYKQEAKLFEELQNLKRNQIQSGRANEALLVKRLIDRFRVEAKQGTMIGLDTYRGPYTYKAYELFLYDQLRKLSHSNDSKLVGARLAHEFRNEQLCQTGVSHQKTTRDYLEEDLRAEYELQRVINRSDQELTRSPYDHTIDIIVPPESRSRETAEIYADEDSGKPEVQNQNQIERDDSIDQTKAEQLGEVGKSDSESVQTIFRGSDSELDKNQKTIDEADEERQPDSKPPQISSASSSRRSSIDAEREKIEQLPLRVESNSSTSGEIANKRVEAEAGQLIAAIMTDALGNISRTASPTGSRKSSSDSAEAEEASTKLVGDLETGDTRSSYNPQAEPEGNSQGQEDEGENGTQVVHQAYDRGSRRRSVVNIGNKIEIIYHNVGIEIDPVTEGDRSSDEDEVGGESAAGSPEEDQAFPVSDPTDKTTTPKSDYTVESQGRIDQEQEVESIDRTMQAEEEACVKPEVMIKQKTGRNDDEMIKTIGAVVRRASSPPSIDERNRKWASIHGDSHRRSSQLIEARKQASAGETTISTNIDPSPQRKVFTGFDLDMLKARTKRRQLSRTESQTNEEDSMNQVQRKPTKRQRAALKPRARSRPPKGPYRVVIPIGQVKERWRNIRHQEQLRLHNQSDINEHLFGQTKTLASDGLSHAKSQPNLESSKVSESCQLSSSKKVKPIDSLDEFSNFLLIYEINKGAQQQKKLFDLAEGNLQRQIDSNQAKWCERKIMNIVDVRALKRTLSLPESLIYSNNLLKRFNILKL